MTDDLIEERDQRECGCDPAPHREDDGTYSHWAGCPAADAQQQAAEHRYLSTGCLHGEHGYCQAHTGLSGAKTPAQCKFCGAKCQCPCHRSTTAEEA